VAAYELWLGPWCRVVEATEGEARAALPGDELLAAPAVLVTRAITIDAPRECVWPWLVQMGRDRGGFYSYTWIENLFGLGIHNAEEILPETQHLAAGDRVALSRRRFWLLVRHLESPRSLVFEVSRGGWVWIFHLAEAGAHGTRLLVRTRCGSSDSSTAASLVLRAVGASEVVMEQRMLRAIKHRAETSHW
jgi:hypothetical protein